MICPTAVRICVGSPATFTVTATDACDGPEPVTCVPPSGAAFPMGCTTVTCHASDSHGNSSICTFPVCVEVCCPPPNCVAHIAAGCGVNFPGDPNTYALSLNGSNACVILDG